MDHRLGQLAGDLALAAERRPDRGWQRPGSRGATKQPKNTNPSYPRLRDAPRVSFVPSRPVGLRQNPEAASRSPAGEPRAFPSGLSGCEPGPITNPGGRFDASAFREVGSSGGASLFRGSGPFSRTPEARQRSAGSRMTSPPPRPHPAGSHPLGTKPLIDCLYEYPVPLKPRLAPKTSRNVRKAILPARLCWLPRGYASLRRSSYAQSGVVRIPTLSGKDVAAESYGRRSRSPSRRERPRISKRCPCSPPRRLP
jgi:hypothetical protein